MNCPRCQYAAPPGADFCPECGSRLALDCPRCGTVNAPGYKFCTKCGQGLSGSVRPAGARFASPQAYTPKHLAEKILVSRASLEGERKQVTVLFVDVSGFTALSEKLDPEDVHQLMNRAFEAMLAEVHRYEGTVNQFLGDGLMALFGDVPPPVLDLVARRAEGNPLFIEELSKALVEDGTLARANGGYHLARSLDEVAIPDTIQGVIMARIDRLAEAAKTALQVASVIGREFTARLVERVSAMDRQAAQALGELQMVITWLEREGRPGARPIGCFAAIEAALEASAPDFVRAFGIAPRVRGALHFGPVVVGEVGGRKRDSYLVVLSYHQPGVHETEGGTLLASSWRASMT